MEGSGGRLCLSVTPVVLRASRIFLETAEIEKWRGRDSGLGNILDKPESLSRQISTGWETTTVCHTSQCFARHGLLRHSRNRKMAGSRFRSRKHFG